MEEGSNVEINGLQFDELSKIRVLDGEKTQQTHALREACTDFTDSSLQTH